MDKRKSRGFSLLELLIVVAIILIIATIAIPSLLRSRQAANESGAVSTLRTIVTAQITYMSSNGGNFGTLPQLSLGAGLLDDRFGTDISPVGGFNYQVNDGVDAMPTDFRVDAIPISAATARFDYYVMPDGVVRYGADTLGNNPQVEGVPVQ